jgi:hypothetical protein
MDNMSPKAKFPVLVFPVDSGLNSELNDMFIETHEFIPLLQVCYAALQTLVYVESLAS